MDWSEYRIIARADQKFFPYGNSYISYSHTPLLIVSTVPVLSYLFSICPVGSDRSCYLFLYLPISLCLYLSYVLPIYDVGAKSHDFDYGLLSPCCPRGSAAVFHHPVQPALYRTQVLIQDLRDLLQLPVLKKS